MIHKQELRFEDGDVKVFNGETYVNINSLDKVFSGTVEVSGATTLSNASIIMSNLPTSDPTVAGQLWSNAGVLTVSAG